VFRNISTSFTAGCWSYNCTDKGTVGALAAVSWHLLCILLFFLPVIEENKVTQFKRLPTAPLLWTGMGSQIKLNKVLWIRERTTGYFFFNFNTRTTHRLLFLLWPNNAQLFHKSNLYITSVFCVIYTSTRFAWAKHLHFIFVLSTAAIRTCVTYQGTGCNSLTMTRKCRNM